MNNEVMPRKTAIRSSSLYDVNLRSELCDHETITSSHLLACVNMVGESTPLPNLQNKLKSNVRITTQVGCLQLFIEAELDQNVCLVSELIEIITSILLLYDEEYKFAITSEDGILLDIREVAQV